jgi:hypothetical protein
MEEFSKARLVFAAPIIRNLAVSHSGIDKESLTTFTQGKDICEFTLKLTTTSGQVYIVYFDKYYLKMDESIFVKHVDVFQDDLQEGTLVKAFDSHSTDSGEVFILGTS